MRILNKKVAEAVQITVLPGGSIQIFDGRESTHSLRVAMRNDEEMPAFTSAGGKGMLAQLTNVEVETL